MAGLIKIGRTENLVQRIRSLSQPTGVPLAFECYHAVKVPDEKSAELEQKLFALFSEHRINPRREFFKMNPEKVVMALSLTEYEPVNYGELSKATETSEAEVDAVQGADTKPLDAADWEALKAAKSRSRRSPLTMSQLGIPTGAELVFTRDDNVKITVLGDRKIQFRDTETSISDATTILMREKFGWGENSSPPTPHQFWLYQGESLEDRRQRLEEEAVATLPEN